VSAAKKAFSSLPEHSGSHFALTGLFVVPVAERISQIPTHTAQDNAFFEADVY
jgi:hypothetical protein